MSDSALGSSANKVVINTNSGTQGFRAMDTFDTGKTFVLNQASNGFEVTAGNTFGITAPFILSGAAYSLTKNDGGILVLSANNPTWNGAIVINDGALRVNGPNANILGTGIGAISITAAGGAASIGYSHFLQLSGGATVTNPLTINTSAGTNTYFGPTTITSGALASGVNNTLSTNSVS